MGTGVKSRPRHEGVKINSSLIFQHGLWINGEINWLKKSREKLLINENLSVKINQANLHSKVEYFECFVTNHSPDPKQAKLIVLQSLSNALNADFTFVSPNQNVIFHFSGESIYLVNGINQHGKMKQCTVQPIWNVGTDRLWSCQESGKLSYQPSARGASASLFTLDLELGPRQTLKSSCWAIKGTDKNTLVNLNEMLLKNRLAFSGEK